MKKPKVTKNSKDTTTKNGLGDALGFSDFNGLGGAFNQGGYGSAISDTGTMFKGLRTALVSNLRQLLSQAYVEIGLIQTIVDVPVDDAMRGGLEIKSRQLDEDQIEDLKTFIDRADDLATVAQAAKWNRLFGGAGIVIVTDQDSATPLDLALIKPDSLLEFKAVDLWELFFDKHTATDGYGDKLPENKVEMYNYYGKKLHPTRVLKLKGIEPPSFIRPRLRGWGFSVVETLVRSLNQYLKATDLSFEVLDEFKLDVFKIKGLVNTLMSPNGDMKVRQRVALANQQKNYQNAIVMDSEDEYSNKQLSFTGLAEVMAGIRMQVAADMRMPLTKLFGISAAGFNSGEDDIEVYNAMVEAQVRGKLRHDLLKVCEIRCQQRFGFVPDDLVISFKPLRVMSSEQEETVKSSKFARLLQAKQAGEITRFEFREAVNKSGLLEITLDNAGDELNPEDPEIDALTEAEPETEEVEEDNVVPMKAASGSSGKQAPEAKMANNAKFEESKHPRADDGKFGEGGGSSKISVKDIDDSVTALSGFVKDKDWGSFNDEFEKAALESTHASLSHEEASKIKTSHSMSFETDPNNKDLHKAGSGKRGTGVNDPSVVVEIDGELFAIDGQHRLNRSIDAKEKSSVVIIKGEFLKKFGITKESFSGKKARSMQNSVKKIKDTLRVAIHRMINSMGYDVAAYSTDEIIKREHPQRQKFYEAGAQDRKLWKESVDYSAKAMGKYDWRFAVWHYRKQGGSFSTQYKEEN